MSGNLVIVESPAKAKTIERYLGPGYGSSPPTATSATCPRSWARTARRRRRTRLRADLRDRRRPPQAGLARSPRRPATADTVYLATDPDREGEAIAWHVAEAAKLRPARTQRVTFHEITEGAIREAFAHPAPDRHGPGRRPAGPADPRPVRRLQLSPLLWRKVRRGLSAGRVQSVAVRLVVDREREIRAFTARRVLDDRGDPPRPGRHAVQRRHSSAIDGDKPADRATRPTAAAHVEALTRPAGRSSQRRGQDAPKRSPAPPFTTSTLQQEASRKLGFSPKRTMSVAQRLYEGIETADGPVGLITYMRTDSVALAGPGHGRGPRRDRRPLRRPVHDAQGPAIQDQDRERAGGPRGDPADLVRARSRTSSRRSCLATRLACTG